MNNLPKEISNNILFIHSFLGCDTTSRIHGFGKGQLAKKIQSNEKLRNLASRFQDRNLTKDEVKKIGEESLLIMYNAKAILDLNSLRYEKFMQKVSTKLTSVDPVSLPPTSAAANFHSQRVYLQIQQWMNENCPLNPTDWGWYEKGNRLHPTMTDKEPAPQELLRVIR